MKKPKVKSYHLLMFVLIASGVLVAGLILSLCKKGTESQALQQAQGAGINPQNNVQEKDEQESLFAENDAIIPERILLPPSTTVTEKPESPFADKQFFKGYPRAFSLIIGILEKGIVKEESFAENGLPEAILIEGRNTITIKGRGKPVKLPLEGYSLEGKADYNTVPLGGCEICFILHTPDREKLRLEIALERIDFEEEFFHEWAVLKRASLKKEFPKGKREYQYAEVSWQRWGFPDEPLCFRRYYNEQFHDHEGLQFRGVENGSRTMNPERMERHKEVLGEVGLLESPEFDSTDVPTILNIAGMWPGKGFLLREVNR